MFFDSKLYGAGTSGGYKIKIQHLIKKTFIVKSMLIICRECIFSHSSIEFTGQITK